MSVLLAELILYPPKSIQIKLSFETLNIRVLIEKRENIRLK